MKVWQSDSREYALNHSASWLLKASNVVGTQYSAQRVEESDEVSPTHCHCAPATQS